MSEVKVWEEEVIIPTYEVGAAEKNPVFLDKRVYQGSSGKVYPYPVIEKISDEKTDKAYRAVFLENEYLKIMLLPELGGRIQRACDKTNNYDFVYYNHVIKPALVGLTGPWISGGIEFNWPQHHRPTTFLPVDYMLQENEDGSKSVLCHDVDQMYGTKGITKFTLYEGKAYLEITGQLYNRTALPQTFLWWANPAVAANEDTQSVFPPDVHAVMDHGKRDVSRFPIATGVYYKQDYSEGVDISRYRNIPVPTSYMAEKSKYDFVGGYDHRKKAGILHIADHHVSPGKKQWTWGNGDFGKAWDRNLTDEDGPYVELMTGMFTDNQPDFTWLKPFEEKTFHQYFMPYKEVGLVKNATIDAAVNMEIGAETVELVVYTTAVHKVRIVLSYEDRVICEETAELSPVQSFRKCVSFSAEDETKLTLQVFEGDAVLAAYTPEKQKIEQLPQPAEAIGEPESIGTIEELYLAGLHIEQYRHATYLPDPYYLEALKRDPGDIRTNTAYGTLLLRRGCFAEAKSYFKRALERMTRRNPNPYSSEAYYMLGLAEFYLEEAAEAYEHFYKATWSNEQQEMSFYYLAAIDARQGRFAHALEMVEKGLVKNIHNIKARGLKAYLLRKLGRMEAAAEFVRESLSVDPFDFVSRYEQLWLEEQGAFGDAAVRMEHSEERAAGSAEKLRCLMRGFWQNYLMSARDYAEAGAYEEALRVLADVPEQNPLIRYYQAYYLRKLNRQEEALAAVQQAEQMDSYCCFPNKLEDIAVLSEAVTLQNAGMAAYYLGNLYFDKLQWQEAVRLWEIAAKQYPDFPTVHRNLSLAYYNRQKDALAAKREMETAFALDSSDARVFLELDQLYKKLHCSFESRLENYKQHMKLVKERDDLFIEYITLLNMTGEHQKAYNETMSRKFHAWEGGEGKITTQYTLALVNLAKQALAGADLRWFADSEKPAEEASAAKKEKPQEDEIKRAETLLRQALSYPENLGEGKLAGTKDNHIYYLLGIVMQAQGKQKEAEHCFELATMGTDEPAGMMYYNDQPADMIMYQGLAKLQLQRTAEAKARFYRLIDYGEQHLYDQMKIEYFAVSLPEFQIFDEDYTVRNRAHCYYLMALGNLGLGNAEKAVDFLKKALEIEPSHMHCTLYCKELTNDLLFSSDKVK